MLLVRQPCLRYYEELEKVEKEGEPKALLDANAEMFKMLSNITGDNIKNFEDIQSLYSTLLAEVNILNLR